MIRGKTRRALVVLHRWLSLAVGLVFGVAALTGAPLAFQHEIDTALSDGVFQPTPGDVGWEEALAGIESSLAAGERVQTFWWPRPQVPVYSAWVVGAETDRTVYLDPGTGEIVHPEPSALTEWLVYLHTNLFGGDVGYWVVVVSTILSVPILLTGLVLWWPGVRTFWRGLRVRWRKGTYPLNYDLHQVTGFLTAVPLLVMCLTGVVMAFPDASRDLLRAALGEEGADRAAWSEVRAPAPPPGWTEAERPDRAEFLRIAEEAVPGDHHRFYLAFPDPADSAAVVHTRLQVGYDPPPFGTTIRVAHDPWTGEILQVIDPRTDGAADRFVDSQAHSWHVGSFGGFWSKLFYLLTCLVGVGLVVTGTVVWWKKRETRIARAARLRERRATAAELTPGPPRSVAPPSARR